MHWLLFYDYVPDYLERRSTVRAEHMAHVQPYLERGELVLGGAFANPADGAVILFRSETSEVAERFAAEDPYVEQGLVTDWRVREWTTVVGADAERPFRPGD